MPMLSLSTFNTSWSASPCLHRVHPAIVSTHQHLFRVDFEEGAHRIESDSLSESVSMLLALTFAALSPTNAFSLLLDSSSRSSLTR